MPDNPAPPIEQHYTILEIAVKLHLSRNAVRNLFDKEPDVIKIGLPSRREGAKYKRRYKTWRIPESVFLRVYARLLNKRGPESVIPTGRREHPAAG